MENVFQKANAIYRGKNLTSFYGSKEGLDVLSQKLQSGDISDICIGDYINMNLILWNTTVFVSWVISAFDYTNHSGISPFIQPEKLERHTIMMIPRDCILKYRKMVDTYSDDSGYAASDIFIKDLGCRAYKGYNDSLTKLVIELFGENHVLTHKSLLTNHVDILGLNDIRGTRGRSDKRDWYPIELSLLNEVMVFGKSIYSSSCFDNNDCDTQVPLFKLHKESIKSNGWYWLSSIANYDSYCIVDSNGCPKYLDSSFNAGVRPYFLFC